MGAGRLGHGDDVLSVALGTPKAMLSRIVPVKSVVSCSTMPTWRRREELHVTYVVAVDEDAPFGDVVEAWNQVDDRRLPRAGGAEQRDNLARRRRNVTSRRTGSPP